MYSNHSSLSLASVLVLLIMAIAGTSVGTFWLTGRSPSDVGLLTSSSPQIRLESLTELVTTKVYLADAMTAEGMKYEGAWIVRGDALLSVNLRQAQLQVDTSRPNTLRIRLPQPRVIQARVDHDRTKTWSIRRLSWIPLVGDPDALRDQAMQKAQHLIDQSAASEEYLAISRNQAECAITALYDSIGWTAIIEWEEPSKGEE